MVVQERGQLPGRRPHRKSRNGCLQCKQRHAKCDEYRPACIGCTTSGRRCSYLDLLPIKRPGPNQDTHTQSTPLNLQSAAETTASTVATHTWTTEEDVSEGNPTNSSSPAAAALPSTPTPTPLIFDVRHLILMHHLDTVVLKDPYITASPDNSEFMSISKAVVETAEADPYLVIEALAISAAHLGTIQTDAAKRMKYFQTAEELQTQALSLFNRTQVHVNQDNCASIFLFSSILGMHALFNVVIDRPSRFLSNFIQYFQIHRGVRIVIGNSWHAISRSGIIRNVDLLDSLKLGQSNTLVCPDESDVLIGLLLESRPTLGEAIFATYMAAVEFLHQIFKAYGRLPQHMRTSAIIAWPIKVSNEYIDLVNQRQPIALLILTYWAILLHRERKFWIFSTSGQLLLESVAECVGPYWDNWLATPRESIGAEAKEQDGPSS